MPRLTIHAADGQQLVPFEGQPVLSRLLAEAGLGISQPCGGRGRCGKCSVKLAGQVSSPNQLEQLAGHRLACQAVLLGDCQVWLPAQPEMLQVQAEGTGPVAFVKPMAGRYGAAVDLGTTTLALRLYDLSDGKLLASATAANPQRAIAADVMGRIGAALEGEGERLQQMALDALAALLDEACRQCSLSAAHVTTLVVVGNTTMLYLLTGRSPQRLARAPFEADHLFGEWVRLLDRDVYLPACMNAFVGADISCAVLASGMLPSHDTHMLVDVGTNGEIALWKDRVLHVASTAAGPAFEGAGIRMGSGSIAGAIDSVWAEDGRITAHTLGDEKARSICGSGLVDAVATLLDLGLVDETGAMEADSVTIQGKVALFQPDIRMVQLAKAAIAAGIMTLLAKAGVEAHDIKAFHLAGGFGSHLDIRNAARIGLIPHQLAPAVRVIGNAALDGAAMLLLNQDKTAELEQLAAASRHVPLGGNPLFNARYVEEMLFSDEGFGG